MRALIRNDEVMPEPRWTPWVRANLQLLTEYDGWALVEDWVPPVEPEEDEGNTYVVDTPECENITSPDPQASEDAEGAGTQSPSGSKKSLLDELKELL